MTGTADDLEELWFGRPDEHGVIALFGRGPEARAWPYRSSPAVPISIALILLLTRWMSGFVDPRFVDPRASLAGRALAACALGVLPTLLLLGVLAAGGWTSLLRARPFHRLLSLEMGIVGSVYVLFAAAIFAHRDLHHLQKIEARERGG